MSARLIHSSFWEDEFFSSLPIFDRLLWIGLITACADDQGRMSDSPAVIRSRIFPSDDIPLEDIENAISRISAGGKINRYVADGKKLIQIVKWWEYQKPRWANRSKYPAPPGWVDRIRYSGAGRQVIEENWNTVGGYDEQYCSTVLVNSTSQQVKVKDKDKDKVKDKDKDKDKDKTEPLQSSEPNDTNTLQAAVNINGGFSKNFEENEYFSEAMKPLIAAFCESTGLYPPVGGGYITKRWHDAFLELLNQKATPDEINATVAEMNERGFRIAGPWSIINSLAVYRSKEHAKKRIVKYYDPDGNLREVEV